jgi:hypothetical protein
MLPTREGAAGAAEVMEGAAVAEVSGEAALRGVRDRGFYWFH